ncbi:unnamed protein product [Rhizophagus irregularis]|nr:unnamed protein product [Rhizophagus irregularis]
MIKSAASTISLRSLNIIVKRRFDDLTEDYKDYDENDKIIKKTKLFEDKENNDYSTIELEFDIDNINSSESNNNHKSETIYF